MSQLFALDEEPRDDEWILKLADRLDPQPSRYVDAPIAWVQDTLGEHLTQDQQSICESVRTSRYTAVQSCHDVGKSYTVSRLASWWIEAHKPGEAFVVTTAPTAAQVGAILWREIGRAHRKGDLTGYVTGNNEWKLSHGSRSPAELVAMGRKPADYDPSAFQGIHARFVLVIIDEACGVPRGIFDAVDSLATNEHSRVVAIGNPDDPASYFAEVCKPGSGWNVIRIDALTSPNFTPEEVVRHPRLAEYMAQEGIDPTEEEIPDSLRDLLVSATWVEERIKRWGPKSPLFQSKVRGRFPQVTLDTLINPHWVTLAQSREATVTGTEPSTLGVDVARYGRDKTIIMERRGSRCRVVTEIPSGPVTEVAGKVIEHAHSLSPARRPPALVDDDGVGGGVVDILEEEGYPCFPIVGGAKAEGQPLPTGKPRFVNLRSQLWWNMREAFAGKSGTGEDAWLDIDELDDELAAQLTNVKYEINRHGQIVVESKEKMERRGLHSPDRADALAYALAPISVLDQGRREERADRRRMVTGDLLERDW